MALQLRLSELEHQFIQDRINSIELNFAELCSHFAKYAKRVAQMRDTGDELAESILKLASKETLNHSLQAVLTKVSDILIAVEDYRDAQIKRLDHKVTLQLSPYSQICKHVKEDLKQCSIIQAKELSKKQQLEKLKGKKSTNWQQINQVKYEVGEAENKTKSATINLEKKIFNFERQKLEDIKKVLLEFINIELIFHCKAVELYTSAYGVIKEIKIDEDLKEFCDYFKSTCTTDEATLPSEAPVENSQVSKSPREKMEISLKATELIDNTASTSGLPSTIGHTVTKQ